MPIDQKDTRIPSKNVSVVKIKNSRFETRFAYSEIFPSTKYLRNVNRLIAYHLQRMDKL